VRPNSAQSSSASSNSADRFQPAKSQHTDATWRVFPGTREAGNHQLQGIGPYNGRRCDPAFDSGRSRTETASLQPGSRSTTSNPASSAAYRPRWVERTETRNPLAVASRPQRALRFPRLGKQLGLLKVTRADERRLTVTFRNPFTDGPPRAWTACGPTRLVDQIEARLERD
jgi:hypothetical protein